MVPTEIRSCGQDLTSPFFLIEEYKRKKPTGIKSSNTFKGGVFAPGSDWELPVNSLGVLYSGLSVLRKDV